MAKIGVTITDPSGKRKTASLSAGDIWKQGANAAHEKMLANRQSLAEQRGKLFRSPGAIGYGQGMQGAQQERLAVNGSLERSLMGLRLKGDASPTSMGASFYGSHGGHKGFYSLDEVDPKVAGKMIGDSASNDDQTQQDARGDKQSEPFGEMYVTRIGMETPETTNDINVYIYYRIHYFTGEGRCFRVSEEMKQRVKTIPLQALWNAVGEGGGGVSDITVENGTVTFKELCYMVGGRFYYLGNQTIANCAGRLVYLEIPANALSDAATLKSCAGYAAFMEISQNESLYVLPLCTVNQAGDAIAKDLRTTPNAAMVEVA